MKDPRSGGVERGSLITLHALHDGERRAGNRGEIPAPSVATSVFLVQRI